MANYTCGKKAVPFFIPGEALTSTLHLASSIDETLSGRQMFDVDHALAGPNDEGRV